jgi:acyl transferase domain-containing protein
MACRFPGAKSTQAFWRVLVDGADAISEVPASRFNIDALYDPRPGIPGKISSRFGGFVADIENFDAGFFGISPREAEAMDPQQRIFLEVAYEALEDAGLTPGPRTSGMGVFLGMMSEDYARQVYRGADLDLTLATGSARGTAAARISYTLGFEGPSLTVDSDRASSLTAIHLACQSLRARECPVALAGASNLILGPELSIACSRSGLLAADGRCKFCDATADGIARSDGFGVLVLKLLSTARRDNDRVYAVIRGSAVANNGNWSAELTRPSARAQEKLLRAALEDAGIGRHEVLYVEAHGTGTRVGDQTECEALGSVLGEGRPADRPCLIGSVKTNIGHAEAAGGMAGIIKVALALERRLLPKSLHLQTPNPELQLAERRLRVQTETGPWPLNHGKPGAAGVSAFGFTGTIAHVVLEAAPADDARVPLPAEPDPVFLPISARSPESLDALVAAYREWFENPSAPDSLARVCYSASVHRQHHPHRLGFVASSCQEFHELLSAYLSGKEPYPGANGCVQPGKTARLAFVFPGQGGQWVGMGRELLRREPVFRHAIDLCDEALQAEAGWSVLGLLRGEAPDALLDEIDYVQPTLTAVMVALAALWRSWGIEPGAVIGFSMGEAAAAQVAGILDIRDAMAVVCRRTRLMKRLRGKGAIASFAMPRAELEKAIVPYGSQLSVAVVASPTSTVLSGDPSAMRSLVDQLESRGVSCRFVKGADVASHSAQMESLLDELRGQLAGLKPVPGSIPLLSTVDDTYLAGPELDADYWARNLRQPVLQMDVVARLLRDGYTAFLEVSPHPVAWTPLLETIRHFGANARPVASLRRDEGERESLLKSVGALYAAGISPNWAELFFAEDRRFAPLPAYRWEKKPYWFEVTQAARALTAEAGTSAQRRMQPSTVRTRFHFLDQLKNTPSGQKQQVLLSHLRERVSRVLKLSDAAALDTNAPLRQQGLTSLMATELALELESTLRCPCSATLLFNYPTIAKLTDHFLSEGVADSSPTTEATSGPEAISAVSAPEPLAFAPSVREALPPREDENARGTEPIAVIGMACRFPGGAANPEDFWRVLRGGVDAITEVPADRWNIERFYDPDPETPGKMYSRWGGFLDAIDLFDAAYFGISPREAEVLDPQQRLLLEVTVEALEGAGQAPDPQNAANVGVFVGIMNNNDFVSVKGIVADPSRVSAHDSTGQATSAAAGRLSYALGFQGPSVAVDTACSSSLVAIHLACQALRSQECQVAVAGGVNVILAPEVTISFCKTRMLSRTGRCKTFDARADGYVRGEGCGIVVLKRLSEALRDKDHILALIRGSAVNQDGRSSSLTAPNGLAQQALVRQTLRVAGLQPSAVDFVEAHGTGTALGDPIELEALGKVLSEGREAQQPFLVSSVKTNIGHLESAAGVAGLIKIILCLQNQEIPPHLHLEQVNPRISLAASRAAIPTRLTPWLRGERKRIAGVSSFGFVGTNAHVILEESPDAPAGEKEAGSRPVHRLLALSARSPEGLKELAGRYIRMLRRSVDVDDLCYTANTGRVHHEVRAAFTGTSSDALLEKIKSFVGRAQQQAVPGSAAPKIAFLFTGQGAQYARMGRELFAVEPAFRVALERCAEVIDPVLQTSLISVLQDEDERNLHQTKFAQPAIFALEYALLEQWRAWGVEPTMVMGHSLGEYTAAVAAGVLSLEQAAKLVVARAQLMQSIRTPGGSAAVFASEDFVRPLVEPYGDSVAVAADNAPERVLIAGEDGSLAAICDALEAKGIEVRRMIGLIAAHCPLMDPILDTFETIAAMTTCSAPAIPMVSTRTGRLVTHAEVGSPRHWRDLIRSKVRFREGMQALHEAGCTVFLEIGPRQTLVRLGEMCLPSSNLVWLSSLSKEKHDQEQMLESLGQLYVRGVRVRWEERHRHFAGRKVPLPTTAFERRRFWPDSQPKPAVHHEQIVLSEAGRSTPLDQLVGRRVRSPLEQVQFEAHLDLASVPMIREHVILNALVMPGAAQIVRIFAATEQLTHQKRLLLREALFPEPMLLRDAGDARLAHLELAPVPAGYDFKISSIAASDDSDSSWRVHLTGRVLTLAEEKEGTESASGLKEEISHLQPVIEQLSGEDFYAIQAKAGYVLGPAFRWLDRVWLSEGTALGVLRRPQELANDSWPGLHPGLIDSCLQLGARLASLTPDSPDAAVLVPGAVEGFRFFGDRVEAAQREGMYCRISMLAPGPGRAALSLAVFSHSGTAVFSIAKLHLVRLSRHDLLQERTSAGDESFRRVVWSDCPAVPPPSSSAGRWLIFADQGGTGDALAELMRRHGQDAKLVRKAPVFGNHDGSVRANPASQSDVDKAFSLLADDPGPPWLGILYLRGLDAAENKGEERFADDPASLFGLFHVAKAMMGGASLEDSPPVWVVTRGVQRTQRESRLAAASQSMLWGLARVMGSENPGILGGLVDLDPHVNDPVDEAAQLLDEIWAEDGERQIAYRSGKRLAPRLAALERGKLPSKFRARPDATYLITGGFGALGRKVAEWLVSSGARHVALLSRRPAGEDASRWIQKLTARDVEVRPLEADVSDMGELAAAFAQIDGVMPPLGGVVHAAGIIEDKILSRLEWPSFTRVQAPKSQGSWNLHVLTRDRPLDFWVVFSSVSAVLGNPGQAAYAAANAYADALVHHRRMQGLPALSINWGPWKGDGMSSQVADELHRRWGLVAIEPSDGVEMLGRLLADGGGQVWAAPLDEEVLQKRSADGYHLSLVAQFIGAQEGRSRPARRKTVSSPSARLQDLPMEERQATVQAHVVDLVRSVTGMDASEPVRVDARFDILGVDSLLTLDLLDALNRFFNLSLPSTILIDCPTIEQLVKYVCGEIARTAAVS